MAENKDGLEFSPLVVVVPRITSLPAGPINLEKPSESAEETEEEVEAPLIAPPLIAPPLLFSSEGLDLEWLLGIAEEEVSLNLPDCFPATMVKIADELDVALP